MTLEVTVILQFLFKPSSSPEALFCIPDSQHLLMAPGGMMQRAQLISPLAISTAVGRRENSQFGMKSKCTVYTKTTERSGNITERHSSSSLRDPFM